MRFSQRHPSPPLFESRWIRHRSPPIIRLWTLLVCGPSGSSNLVFGHTDGARELAAPRRRAHGADLQPRPSSRVAGNRRGWGWALVLAPAFLCVPTPAGPPVGARRSNPGHPPGWPAISEAGGGPLCSPLPFFLLRPRQVRLSGLGEGGRRGLEASGPRFLSPFLDPRRALGGGWASQSSGGAGRPTLLFFPIKSWQGDLSRPPRRGRSIPDHLLPTSAVLPGAVEISGVVGGPVAPTHQRVGGHVGADESSAATAGEDTILFT